MHSNRGVLLFIGIFIFATLVIIAIIAVAFSLSRSGKRKQVFNINVDQFIKAAGGLNNIKKVSSNNSRLIFNVFDPNVVNSQEFRDFGASGVVKSGQKITVIVGKLSQDIAYYINEKLK